MVELRLRNRHRLRNKNVRGLEDKLGATFSMDIDLTDSVVDMATVGEFDIIIIDNQLYGFMVDSEPFFTVRGILHFRPTAMFVTVDMGAVKFVSNGADIMAPGIIDADRNINTDDLVWIRDEKNLQPLAIGRAMMSGVDMISGDADKAIKSIHYVGDKIWDLEI